MLQTSARLLHVLSLLQSRRFWNGGELARALNITERSVRRDMEKLRTLGYPIHATAGVGGGYQLGTGKELPPLPLEDEEAVAVAVGLRAAATGSVKGLEEAAIGALAKLEKVLPMRLRKRVRALQAVSVQLGEAGPVVDAEVLSLCAQACREEELLRFDYLPRDGEEAQPRRAEPYRLVHTRDRWYLLAFDLEKSDWRTFRVDRIAPQPRPRFGERFRSRPLPSEDVAAYVSSSISTDVYRFKAKVKVHAPASEVRKRWSPAAGRVEASNENECWVYTGAQSLQALSFHLGMLGYDFDIVESSELVQFVASLGARLSRAAARAGR